VTLLNRAIQRFNAQTAIALHTWATTHKSQVHNQWCSQPKILWGLTLWGGQTFWF